MIYTSRNSFSPLDYEKKSHPVKFTTAEIHMLFRRLRH